MKQACGGNLDTDPEGSLVFVSVGNKDISTLLLTQVILRSYSLTVLTRADIFLVLNFTVCTEKGGKITEMKLN